MGGAESGPVQITDVLGRVRTVEKIYEDGAWNCPFCTAAVSPARDACHPGLGYAVYCGGAVHCPNPACFANPHYPVDRARKELAAAAERRAQEERQRKEVNEWSRKRAEEDRQARVALSEMIKEEAKTRGACVGCALWSLRFGASVAKFTRHRKPGTCPRGNR